MRTVAAVIDQGALTFDLAIPCEVFGVDRRDIVDPWYELLVVAAGRHRCGRRRGSRSTRRTGSPTPPAPTRSSFPAGPIRTIRPRRSSAQRCGGRGAWRQDRLRVHGGIRARGRRPPGRRRATTHWLFADRLCERYPRVEVDPNVLYVEDGSIFTSAGTAAGMDLCLHLVALDHGADVAVRVARRIVMPPHRAGGQAQYVEQRIDAESAAEPLAPSWTGRGAGSTPDRRRRPRPRGAVSPRTLTRRFRSVTGLPPGECWRGSGYGWPSACSRPQRPVDGGGADAGYDSETTMRAQFAPLGTSPRSYRRSFGRQAASSEPR